VTHGGMMRCLMEYVLKAGQCSGLFANLAIPYAAIMVLDIYWLDIYWLDIYWLDIYWLDVYWLDIYWLDVYWLDIYWLDDIDKLDCFQSVVMDSKVAKVSIT
jgi:broad specificity phosphatase PhoE